MATTRDLEHLDRLPADWPVDKGRLLFSIKEAVYKASYPLTKLWLDFEQIEVVIDRYGEFDAHIEVPGKAQLTGASAKLRGRWTITPDLILAATVVPALKGIVRDTLPKGQG